MKKKLLTIVLACSLSVGVVACGETDSKSNDTPQTSEDANNSQADDGSETSPEESNDNNVSEATEKTLSDIENYMIENGAVSGDRIKPAAEMIGGIDGFKYTDSNTEVYEFDTNSEEYLKLSNGEEVSLQGMEGYSIGAVSVNGKFVLIGNPSQETINIFNSFK